MKCFLFFLPFLLFSDQKTELVQKVTQALETFQKKHNIPGLATGFTVPIAGETYEKIVCVGNTDRQSKISIKEETPFRIGRLTETFTATMLSDLVTSGKVKFDDPVEVALPRGTKLPTKLGSKITIDHLLHHCSGLPKTITGAFNRKEASKGTLINYVTHLSLQHQPGTSSIITDTDYALLSLVISNLHNDVFCRVMQDDFLPKLGFKETKFELTFSEKQRAAIGHRGLKPEVLLADREWSPYAAARGLFSRPAEILHWMRMHLNGDPRVKPLHSTVKTADAFGQREHAMVWEVGPLSNDLQLKTFQISDSYLGYSIYCAFIPSMNLGIFVLSNTDEPVVPLGKEVSKLLSTYSGNV